MRYTWLAPIALASLTLACAGQEAEQEYPDAVTADPAHYTVEFENDAARILRITYSPGETSVMHHHPPNCAIFRHDQPTSMESPDGEVTVTEASAPGTVICNEGDVHLPTNAGDGDLDLILVEFKEGASAGPGTGMEAQNAVEVAPEHYAVEFENDAVRIVRISYAAGESGGMHSHGASCGVWGAGATADEVTCQDAREHAAQRDEDSEPIAAIFVEFKGRVTP